MEYINIWIKHLSIELFIIHPQSFINYVSYFPDEMIDKIKEKTYIGITNKIERIISELDITNKELLEKINNKLRIYENDQSELFKEITKEINKRYIYPNSYETLLEIEYINYSFLNKLSLSSEYENYLKRYLDKNTDIYKEIIKDDKIYKEYKRVKEIYKELFDEDNFFKVDNRIEYELKYEKLRDQKVRIIIILLLFALRINYEWVEIDINKKFLFEYIENYEDELFIVIRDKSIFGISLNLLSFIKDLNIENLNFINFMLCLNFMGNSDKSGKSISSDDLH